MPVEEFYSPKQRIAQVHYKTPYNIIAKALKMTFIYNCGRCGNLPRARFAAAAAKLLSALLARPILLDGCPALAFDSYIATQRKPLERMRSCGSLRAM